jgi:DNA polymerase III alpha subunit
MRKQHCLRRIEELSNEGSVKLATQWANKLEQVIDMPDYFDTDFDEIEGEIEVLGFSFKEKLDEYDLSIAEEFNPDRISEYIIGAEVIKWKQIKDKKKKDMAFVTLRTKQGAKEFVMFSRAFKPMVERKVYLVSIAEGKFITDCREAERRK